MDIRVQQAVVDNLSTRPQTVAVGPFIIGWDPTSASRFINYATPLVGASITSPDVDELVSAFQKIDRLPRLEYVVSCAPELEEMLTSVGFSVEARHDYLVCTPSDLVMPPMLAGFVVTDDASAGHVAVQKAAFGEDPAVTDDDLARLQRAISQGGVVMQVHTADGRCVAAGQAAPPGPGRISEVGGIAVDPDFRRRGLGGIVTAAIAARLFERGTEVAWLEASGEDSWRVYERVGYAATGKRLYMALD